MSWQVNRRRLPRRSEAQPGVGCHNGMKAFHCVYILESSCGGHFYTGLTDDLAARLAKHNAGVLHTARHRLWVIKTAVAFHRREKAAAFETYLESSSGRAFAMKRL